MKPKGDEASKGEVKAEERPKVKVVEERVYTIPLRRAWLSPRKRRAPRAMRLIKGFVQRHMKLKPKAGEEVEEEVGKVIIDNEVNEWVWRHGIEKPPRRIKVRVSKDEEGNVYVRLAEGG